MGVIQKVSDWLRGSHTFGVPRNPRWAKTSRAYLRGKSCAACGRKTKLVIHHKVPVHVDNTLEMMVSNWLVLCFGATACHLGIGHSGDFKSWNPDAEKMAAEQLARFKKRPYLPEAKAA